jgi:hypothetical protein
MKNIDIKSLLIGGLLTSTIFLGVAATSPKDKWDSNQMWFVDDFKVAKPGWEPFCISTDGNVLWRKRDK